LLRFADLDRESAWWDEIVTARLTRVRISRMLKDRAERSHPPLYFLAARAWTRVFGASDVSLRVPSAICGSLTVLAVYAFASLLFRDRRVGVLAAMLCALSPLYIYYSQRARMYSALTLMGVLSAYWFIRVLRQDSLKAWLVYLLTSILLVYTHNSGWLLLIVQSLAATVRNLRDRTTTPSLAKWWRGQLCVALTYSPWLLCIFGANPRMSAGDYSLTRLAMTFLSHFGSTWLVWVFLAAIAIALLSISPTRETDAKACRRLWGLDRLRYLRLSSDNKVWFLLAWWLVPTITLAGLTLALGLKQAPRYTLASSLGLYVLAAKGLARIPFPSLRASAVGAFLILFVSPLTSYYTEAHERPWREVVPLVEAGADRNGLILLDTNHPAFRHYGTRKDIKTFCFYRFMQDPRTDPLADPPSQVGRDPTLWLILWRPGHSCDSAKYLRLLRAKGHAVTVTWHFHDITVHRLVRHPARIPTDE
jgi:hypothetical protein